MKSIIRFILSGDSSPLEEAGKRGEKSLSDLKEEAKKSGAELGKWSAAAAAAAVAVAAAMVNCSIATAREMDRMAQVANAGLVEFQRFAAGARTVGIESDKLADIIKDVNDRIGDFVSTGGGPMADFFENIAPKVGVTIDQFRRLSGPEALQLYVDSLQKAGLSQAEMTFYMEAMASDATALIPLLKDGGTAMAAQADQAERLGLVLSEIETEQLKQAGQAMAQAGEIISALSNHLAIELAPLITAISRQFREAAEEGGGFGGAVSSAVQGTIKVVGFLANAVDGVKRVGTATADSLVYGFALIEDTFYKVVRGILAGLDMIPGVDLTANVREMEARIVTAQGVMKQAAANIRSEFERPLAGDVFQSYAAEAKKASQEAAKAAVEARAQMAATQPSGMPAKGDDEASKKAAQEAEALAKKQAAEAAAIAQRLDALKMSFATEQELIARKHEDELKLIQEGLAAKQLTRDQAYELEMNSFLTKESALSDIEAEQSEKRAEFAKKEAEARKAAISGMMNNLTSLMNSGSRKMFEVGKAAAIAQAVVNTYNAATGAYAALAPIPIVGPALGVAAAGAAVAAGMANVSAIRSQQFGGGASARSTATPTANVNAAASGVGQGNQPTQRTNITLQGDFFSREGVIGLLNLAMKDGFTIS